jgi:hypothetical protein
MEQNCIYSQFRISESQKESPKREFYTRPLQYQIRFFICENKNRNFNLQFSNVCYSIFFCSQTTCSSQTTIRCKCQKFSELIAISATTTKTCCEGEAEEKEESTIRFSRSNQFG